MPTAPTEFTLNADVFRLIADTADVGADMDLVPLTGLQIFFDPDVDPNHLLVATLTPRSIFIKPGTVTGYIRSNGRMYDQPGVSAPPSDLTDPGNLGVRLLASGAELNLVDPLTYKVSSNSITISGSPWSFTTWHIPAPTTDVTVDLASLGPVSGSSAEAILRGPAGPGADAVRLNGSNQVVFSYQGVDLPVPLSIAPSSVPDGSVTTVKIVDANVTLAKLSSGVATSLSKADSAAQIAGDLSGTSASPVVAKINGVGVTGTPTSGQVPTATSGTAATWQTPASGFANPLTTKGDLISRTSSTTVRRAVGTDGQVLKADSAQTDGLTWGSLIKADVGLANVDNTSDVNKPVSTAQAAADALNIAKSLVTTKGDIIAATAASTPARLAVGTNTQLLMADSAQTAGVKWASLTKTDIGLGNVDNTSDVNKPVSTAQAAADALNIAKSLVTTKGDIIAATAASTPVRKAVGTDGLVLKADSAQIDGLAWGSLTKTDVGLGNIDNVADANKPVSVAQAAADALNIAKSLVTTKGDIIATTAASTPVRLAVGGDAQVLTADSTQAAGVKWAAAAGGYTDPLTTAGDLVVRGASATLRKAIGANTQVLRVNTANADKLEWAALASVDVGLANVDNTSDVNKPVSTAQAAADALNIAKSLVTTKGDIITASAASTPARLPVGTDAQILTADSTQPNGIKWAPAADAAAIDNALGTAIAIAMFLG